MNLFDEISSRPNLHARHEAAILLRPRIRQVAAADNIEYVNEVPVLGHCVRFGTAGGNLAQPRTENLRSRTYA